MYTHNNNNNGVHLREKVNRTGMFLSVSVIVLKFLRHVPGNTYYIYTGFTVACHT